MEDLSSARALAYDMVYNGVEVSIVFQSKSKLQSLELPLPDYENFMQFQIGGGSLRIYKREIQQKVLEIVGISLEEVSKIIPCAFTIN